MNTAHLSAHSASVAPLGRHLTLVEPDPDRTPPSGGSGLAALAGGLATGFVLAAVATLMGGGDAMTSLRLAGVCGAAALVARARARRGMRRHSARVLDGRSVTAPRHAPQRLSRAA